jgi:hypothetical protein
VAIKHRRVKDDGVGERSAARRYYQDLQIPFKWLITELKDTHKQRQHSDVYSVPLRKKIRLKKTKTRISN